MALSPQDKAFYEEKLGLKSFGFLLLATAGVGAISWPVLIYLQDSIDGDTSKWSMNVAYNLAVMGFLLGTVVSVILYLLFKFFLEMEWLPKPRK